MSLSEKFIKLGQLGRNAIMSCSISAIQKGSKPKPATTTKLPSETVTNYWSRAYPVLRMRL